MDAAPSRSIFPHAAVLLCAVAVLLALAGHAWATFAQSNVFAFDTRDSNSGHYAESGVFAFDTRAADGLSGSRVSGLFSFDTRQALAAQLRVSGPPSVVGGTPATYRALLQYPGGAEIDVTEDAGWRFAGSEPIATTFSHSSFTPAPGNTARSITVTASYEAYGRIESAPYSVVILPRFTVRLSFEPGLTVAAAQWVYFTASTSGPNGPAPANSILWELDGDGDFNDAAGATSSALLPLGRTSIIGVRATDSAGAIDLAYKYVPVERRASSEPDSEPIPDVSEGAFTDGNGDSFTFDAAKAAAGLVVVTHGLFDKASSRWMKDMATRINGRLASGPNVCLYDWKEMADPTLYTTGGNRSGRDQWALLKIDDFLLVRPYGQAHGRILAELIEVQRALGKVVKSAPVHLIGHSAGGFVVGECARQLRRKGYGNIQITMLDTPAPFVDHVEGETLTPSVNPVMAERFITTEWGGKGPVNYPKNWWFEWHTVVGKRSGRYTTRFFIEPNDSYLRKVVSLPRDARTEVTTTATTEIGGAVSGGVLLHFWAHEWYLETVDANPDFPGGFNTSPLLATTPPSQPPVAADSFSQAGAIHASATAADIPLDGFQTFGNVSLSNGIYSIAETGNAGIHKEINLPVGTRTLRFRLRATGPTDGDMVVVEWNGTAQMVIVNPSANSGMFFDAEAELAQHAAATGVLTIKLVSPDKSYRRSALAVSVGRRRIRRASGGIPARGSPCGLSMLLFGGQRPAFRSVQTSRRRAPPSLDAFPSFTYY